MSRWWRAYDEAVDDPKLILLSDKAHRAWFSLMCTASSNNGVLPDIKIVAVKLRTSPQRAAVALTELVAAGLFDQRADGAFEPHNWSARQYKTDVTDPTNAQRQKRYRDRSRNGQTTVTETVTPKRPETETETETETDSSEAKASGAKAPPDPSDPERQFFARGKELLGKSSGGQLAKLLKVSGGNVSLARSKLELAATKDRPAEFVVGVIRAGPSSTAKPLTAHQRERETGREILDDLEQFVVGSSRSQAGPGLLRHDPGDGSASIHGGIRGDVIVVPATRAGKGG